MSNNKLDLIKKGLCCIPAGLGFTYEVVTKIKDIKVAFDDCANEEMKNDKYQLKSNVRRILSKIEKDYGEMVLVEEKEKSGNMLLYTGATVASIICPLAAYVTASYVTYKTINNVKETVQNKSEYKFNYDVFMKLYNRLGLKEKMEDILYEPSTEEINTLIENYEKITKSNIFELLYQISNK